MDKKYWETYYKTHRTPDHPSLFAQFVHKNYLSGQTLDLLELGCGNGRDSIFFARHGLLVWAVDQISSEIGFLNQGQLEPNVKFLVADFTDLVLQKVFACIYSRFTLHSILEKDEVRVLNWCYHHLLPQGILCVEARSVHDPKLQVGQRLSDNENVVDGHYRRYFYLDRFQTRLRDAGFAILFAEERCGFAPFDDEDPPIVRVVARRVSSPSSINLS